jgi:ribose 5-phosphate isomerase B
VNPSLRFADRPGPVAVGADHAGFRLKNELVEQLRALGHEVVDHGSLDGARCDYPDLAHAVARAVASGAAAWGLLVCGTGVGMAMAANRVPGVRAAVVSDTFSARATRLHNDANVLCLGERVVGGGLAAELLLAFLDGRFEGGRHQQRLDKLQGLEARGATPLR